MPNRLSPPSGVRQWLFSRSVRRWLWVVCGVVILSVILVHQYVADQSAGQSYPAAVSLDRLADVSGTVQQRMDLMLGVRQISYPVPAQNTFFVAPDGDEANTGIDIDSPWTLAKALRDAPNGATIVLRGGTYRTGSRKPENGGETVNETLIGKAFTIQPYADEIPILKGSLIAEDWVRDGNAWKTTWIYHFPPESNASATEENPMAAYSDGVWIDENPLWQVGAREQVKPGTFYIDYATNTLYIGTDPAGKTVEATAFAMGFNNWQMREPGVTIQGLTLMHYAILAVSLDCPNARVENNRFIQNRNIGFFVGNPGVQRFEPYGVDAIVRNNEFIGNGAKAVGTVRGHRLLFENNIVRGNNIKRADYSSGGAKFVRSDGVVVRHNLFEENINVSVWFDVGATNAQIIGNIIQNNDGDAIFWEISDQSIIAGNLITHNNAGVRITGSTNTAIYNNTFNDNLVAIFAPDPDRRRTEQGPGYTENTIVKNNIFSLIDRLDAKRALVFKTGICEQPLVSELDYNIYYRSHLNQPKELIEWEKYPYAENCQSARSGTVYNSLDAFQRESGWESHGFEVIGDPSSLFVDAANGNYHLSANSPAVAAGSPLPPDVAEALAWKAGVVVDLGAYQS